MRQTVRFPSGAIARQREDGALSNEMRRGMILVQICEEWSERFASAVPARAWDPWRSCKPQMGILGKESHLSLRIATIGAMGVSLDEFSDRKAIRGFCGEIVMCLLMRVFLMIRGWLGFCRASFL